MAGPVPWLWQLIVAVDCFLGLCVRWLRLEVGISMAGGEAVLVSDWVGGVACILCCVCPFWMKLDGATISMVGGEALLVSDWTLLMLVVSAVVSLGCATPTPSRLVCAHVGTCLCVHMSALFCQLIIW